MKCEVFWKNEKGKNIHTDHEAEATHLTIGSALDDNGGPNSSLYPMIFAVCDAHAHIGEKSGWKTISSHVAKHIGWMAQALREAP